MRILYFLPFIVLAACQNKPKERVLSTYGDGKPMMIVVEDPKTGAKLQEKTFTIMSRYTRIYYTKTIRGMVLADLITKMESRSACTPIK